MEPSIVSGMGNNADAKESCITTYFGYVDVADGHVTIVDRFSDIKFELDMDSGDPIRDVQLLINEAVLLLTDLRVIMFSHRDESLRELRITNDGDAPLEWSAAEIPCRRLMLPPELDHWSHWLTCQRRRFRPAPSINPSADRFLACSLYDVFLVCNRNPVDLGTDGTISIYKIFDSRQKVMIAESVLPGTAVKTSAGHGHLAVLVRSDGRMHLYLHGFGNHGEMGCGDVSSSTDRFQLVELLKEVDDAIVDVSTGGWHTCVLTDKNDVYGWGWNRCSQLGYSPDEFSIQPVPFPFDLDRRPVGIACGDEWTFIRFDDGTARIFGECEMDPEFFSETKTYYF